jgi:xylan 1,4-beta-xylosidase
MIPSLPRLAAWILAGLCCIGGVAQAASWRADNGNGTYTNPLFYDEFSDPDIIRVGEDFYMTGTTMHSMPGLPLLTSRDLVNWKPVSYALQRLDLGPEYRLEDGKDIYGKGIWAPSLRYHNGTFYIFSNVNGQTTQIFSATNPRGPWTHRAMKKSLHDLSVLFDDDGKVWVVWGYQNLHIAQLTDDLTDIVPGTEREAFTRTDGLGEGSHFYKINGKYYIITAWYAGRMKMPAARADRIDGPWEVNKAIAMDEDFGLNEGNRAGRGGVLVPANLAPNGRVSLHQGGIVQTAKGDWWGWSMQDYNSVGRLTSLSPVTWQDGWPWFGLPGNLGRTPRTWIKPDTGAPQKPVSVFSRDDAFSGKLNPVWQWSHVPVDSAWSLAERPGFLRLHALPAADLWSARNTLTQRAMGLMSSPVAVLDTAGLKTGDVAGLSLFTEKFATLQVERSADGLFLVQRDTQSGKSVRQKLDAKRVWLSADADYMTEKARFSWSSDGKRFTPIGNDYTMVFTLKTFQGMRYALFAYNTGGATGGHADFDSFAVREPHPRGLMRGIPLGKSVTLTAFQPAAGKLATGLTAQAGRGVPARFQVEDRGKGRVALRGANGLVTVAPDGGVTLATIASGAAQVFQWSETPTGETVLMSLMTNRYLRIDPATGAVRADSPGPQSDGMDGARFVWDAK